MRGRIGTFVRARPVRLCGRFVAASLCAGAVIGAAEAPSRAPLDLIVSSTLERIVAAADDGGVAELAVTSATVASHADQLIYSVRFTNAGAHVLDTVRITSAVPAGVKYVAGSASGPGSEALFSVDNARTFGRPVELRLAAPDGSKGLADAADYTHVRWVLDAPLDAGAAGSARFRAVPR
jgi:uncharacterized repeat protein (TIGR01451 family)